MFSVNCLKCGELTRQLAGGNPKPHHTQAVMECTKCKREYLVTVQMRPVEALVRNDTMLGVPNWTRIRAKNSLSGTRDGDDE
jgi:NAD-dependent SIR2 family protein deacetylase